MDCIKTGSLIKRLRQQKGLTQQALAERIGVSDKAVSKWERGLGCPDVTLLRQLSHHLEVALPQLLTGELDENETVGGNMKNTCYFICPTCGSITASTGNAEISCCGRSLAALQAKKASPDEALKIDTIEDEWYLESDHPMEKDNYISFVALLTGDRMIFVKLYPEWEMHIRLPKRGHGKLLWYSTTKGLFYQLL